VEPSRRFNPSIVTGLQNYLFSLKYNPGPIDGIWGIETIAAFQRLIRAIPDGDFGPQTIRAAQQFLVSKNFPPVGGVDGIWGPASIYALTQFLQSEAVSIVPENEKDDNYNQWGISTTMAFQRYLRNEGFNPGAIDGDWGPECYWALQRFLNWKILVNQNDRLLNRIKDLEGDTIRIKEKQLDDLIELKGTLQPALERINAQIIVKEQEKKKAEETGNICVICMDSAKEYVFVPCGHLCCCSKCINVTHCPMCRVLITQKIRVFN